MKPIPRRARTLAQTDLFDAVATPMPLATLQQQRDELVVLLSQLLWQVASQVDVDNRLEDDYEQDQP